MMRGGKKAQKKKAQKSLKFGKKSKKLPKSKICPKGPLFSGGS